ncbi:MAG: hypothetical protein IKQ30_02425 [Bacteroidales bacterium]|nr:hypothetical protein [Bacteroidales bacterium]
MKKTFLRILPVVAAVLLATSCSKDDDGNINNVDTPQTTDANSLNPEQPAEQDKTVKIPFSVKVDGGESLSKITYAVARDGEDKEIWNKVSRSFNASTDVEGASGAIKLTVNGKEVGSGVTGSTLNLKYEDSKFVFYGDITVDADKVDAFTNTGIDLVGEFTVTGTELPTSSNESLAKLMTSCSHTYKADFKSNTTDPIQLYDQNAYVAIQMSPLQRVLEVTVDGVKSNYDLNSAGQVWIAVAGGTTISTNFLDPKTATAGHISTIDRAGFVDLGIPGILWADKNLGATNVYDYGNYYAWGEVEPKTDYSWATYTHGNGSDYDVSKKYNTTDGKTTLEPADDAATYTNTKWKMPELLDFAALKSNCYWVWVTDYNSSVKGYVVYKKKSGDSPSYSVADDTHIFLPAAGDRDGTVLDDAGSNGCYWSSSLDTEFPYGGSILYFSSGSVYPDYWNYRQCGQSVRPVRCK